MDEDTIAVELAGSYEVCPPGLWLAKLDSWELVDNKFKPGTSQLMMTFRTECKDDAGYPIEVRAYSAPNLGERARLGQLARACAGHTGIDPAALKPGDPLLNAYPIGKCRGVAVGLEIANDSRDDGSVRAKVTRITSAADVREAKAQLRRQLERQTAKDDLFEGE